MEKKTFSKLINMLHYLLGVAILILVVAVLLILRNPATDSKYIIDNSEIRKANNSILFLDFVGKKSTAQERIITLLEDDYDRFLFNDYDSAHVSMWNEGKVDASVYETYFAKTILYGQSTFSSIEELQEYLIAVTQNDKLPDNVYIGMDPYELSKTYYRNHYYDVECDTFEEYLEESIFPFFENYPSVSYRIILPVISMAKVEEGQEELEQIYTSWYTFMMYLRWWDNVSVDYYGDLEWLVLNDANFTSDGLLDKELEKLMNIYVYSSDTYTITPPELADIFDNVEDYATAYAKNKKKYERLADKKIVFYGDSLFSYPKQKSASIPKIISGISGAECFDLSIGGTTGAAIDENSFPNIAATAVGLDADTFMERCNSEDDIIFVILYGMNDYLLDVDIQQFALGLFNGTESVIQDFPKAKLLFVAPYQCAIKERERSMESISDAVRDVAKGYHADYIDLFRDSGIDVENGGDFLEDGIHPTFATDYILAKMIMDKLASMK